MATIADLVINVLANTSGAQKDMTSFGSKVQGSFGKALLPAVGVLGGIAFAAKKAGDAAVDLGESQNAVNVVFGKSGQKLAEFAKVADKEAGLSMRELNSLVVPLGASFTNLGDSQDVAATKSINLAKRAADMASVFNTSVPEAMTAIQAALRGESDPIEKFGVGMNAAAVQSKAMSMGLAKTTAALTDGDKAQARYALLMEQTTKFQGDFVNTSGSVANAARINAAAQENVAATIGTAVVPIMTMYQNALAAVTGFMAEHVGLVKIAAVVLAGLAAAVIAVNAAFFLGGVAMKAVTLATKLYAAAQWLLNAAMSANPLAIVIIALIALGVAIVVAYRHSETFRNIVTAAWNAVKSVTMTVFNFVKEHIGTVMAIVKAIASTNPLYQLIVHFNDIKAKVTTAINAVKTAVETAVGAIKSAVQSIAGVVEGVIGTFQRLADTIRSLPTPGGLVKKGLGAIGLASGGNVSRGGWAMVGERGPELVNLPGGSTVFSNRESKKAGEGGEGGRDAPLIGEVHVHDRSDYEVLAARVERRLAFGS